MGLEGTWYNELGSTFVIENVSQGTFAGRYETGTSGGCASGEYAVLGRTDVDSGGETLGWVVTWHNQSTSCASTTTWSGLYRTVDGVETITAFWLLTIAAPPDEEWESTIVGKDTFTRTAPAEEGLTGGVARTRPAHP